MFKKFSFFTFLVLVAAFTINIYPAKEPDTTALGTALTPIILDSNLQACIDQMDRYLSGQLPNEPTPGAAFAIVKDSFVVYQKGFGLRKANTLDSINQESVFRLASLSKGFAGVLTGLLVQDSLLNWDDKVVDYVPDFELKSRKHTSALTLRHLLSHTTGLPRHTYSNLLNMGVDYPTIKAKLKEVNIAHPPGTQYNYQNVIFSVIGDVVEAATGRPYDTLLQEYIFEPLQMNEASTGFESLQNCYNLARPHTIAGGAPNPMDLQNKYYSVSPAAGVNASISDMAKWLLFLLGDNPEVAKAETLAQIFEPHADMHRRERGIRNWHNLEDAFYAMGWRVVDYRGKRIIYHGGFVNGYRGEIAFIPEEKVGAVFLSNGYSQTSFDCMPHFFDLYLDNEVEKALQ
jgi:beta-lactamase class C